MVVFASLVLSALWSGLTAFVLSQHDYDVLDGFALKKLRAMLRGDATKKEKDADGNAVKYRALTNHEVWIRARLPDTRTALTMQRLQWFQTVLKNPYEHQQYLTALWEV